MQMLLIDMLWRWWWVYGIIAFYMMFTTFAALPLGNQDASLAALMYSTAVLSSLAVHLNLHKGYIKVVTTLPVRPKDIAIMFQNWDRGGTDYVLFRSQSLCT